MATTLKVEAAADNKAATFILENEDHTLGNSLR